MTATVTTTERCLRLVTGTESAPPEWADLAGRVFADTMAVLCAGARMSVVAAVAGSIEELDGRARSLATGRAMNARSAALVDGTAAHALDYDDVDDAVIAHPSAVLVPALLAAGVARPSDIAGPPLDGNALIVAYRSGIRVSRLIAAVIGIRDHYEAGWHSTSTIGTIAAAGAIARLWQLPADTARNAFGIAATLAAGSRQGFGSMIKPLHAGIAGANGLLAVQLAARGTRADSDMLDGPLGFLTLHHGAPERGDLDDLELDTAALNTKLFPCCYYTHAAAEAAIEQAGRSAADITDIEVVVQPGGLAPLVHHRPTTGDQAKFSMEFVVAAALLDGRLTLSTFDDRRVAEAPVQQLLRRVEVTMAADPPIGPPRGGEPFAAVTVRYIDGSCRTTRTDRPLGHASRPVAETALRAKFDDCVRGADSATVDRVYRTLRDLSAVRSVTELVDTVATLSDSAAGAAR
ncbi:MmgE/PrpD family protein [Nocardia jinanensis]|uniref:MmgE/PrpD family protein n=1 Tax=Nocardia jinanensis TaxID=382504 RepID=A0A917RVN7_9NOCA|nr:MmgE/PrpD family protein [Nocardia jinanensis]GGL40153.1 hypothetical protein GCM10011588_63650 [Nocardia jinanensis]